MLIPPKRRQLPLPAALLAALVALCLAGSAPAGSAAASSAFDAAPEASLVFTKASASLVGSQALVRVRCEGPRGAICNGTAVLRVRGEAHEVPFSVSGGTRSSLAVPVGSAEGLHGKRAVAIARTAQQTGGYLRAREVLRLR